MSIIDAALHRSRTIIALLVFILLAGTIAYVSIPKESDPDISIPIIYVSISHDGISPEDAERLLVRPVEKEVRSIEGVKEMRSSAYEGGANVLLEFEAGFDVDKAMDDVREKVDLAKPELPEDSDEPTVNEVNLSLFPVLVVNLSGTVPERTLLKIARALQDDIEGLPSVLEAKIQGDREEVVDIIIDPMKVDSYGLQPSKIFAALENSNILIAAGAMDTGKGRFSIKVPGLFESVQDIMSMPVKSEGDAVVTIADLAEIRKTFKDPEIYARVNGEPAITLEVSKRTGENIIETIEKTQAVVLEAAKDWPEGVKVSFSQDKSGDIRDMLKDLQNNVTSAILLVMIIVVAALGLRGGLLVGVAIPGSFLAGILVLYTAGFTVNIVVLFSLILAVGMLVDGAIVVIEYADRKLAEGEPKEVAYGLAAKRMAWPIIASTATTLAAFLPLLFWPGIVGEFMKYMPITLIATLTASLAMALLFIPVLGANLTTVMRVIFFGLLGAVAGGAVMAALGELLGGFAPVLAAILGVVAAFFGWRIGGWVGKVLDQTNVDPEEAKMLGSNHEGHVEDHVHGLTKVYVKTLDFALKAPFSVMCAGVAVLVLTNVAYQMFGKGIEFFPDVEPKLAFVNVHARGNLSVSEKDTIVRQVEDRVLAIQRERGEFKTIYSTSGLIEHQDGDAEDVIGKILLEFNDWDTRRKAKEIQADIRERTENLAGIWVEFRQEENGPPVGKPIQVQLASLHPEMLPPVVDQIRAKLESMDGLIDVEDSRPIPGIEWVLTVDRAQASKFGTDVLSVGNIIQLVTKGLKISDYRPNDADDEVDIVARYPIEDRTIDQLDSVRINTDLGLAPLGSFVKREAEQKTGTVNRVDGKRVLTVKSEVVPGTNVDAKVREIRAWLETINIPEDVTVTFKGEDEEQKKTQDFLSKAFGVALFLMAVILVTQFNSFYSAFLILFAVIMSTAGVLIGLMVIQQPFGMVMSGVGVIALAGIVVNNNIVLIDTFDRLKETGLDVRHAILQTGAQRLRPVMLTTITTILGLIPMVMQTNIDFATREISRGAPSTQWWVQLSTAIAAGLAFATVLTLILTPCALMVRANFAAWRERRRNRKSGGGQSNNDSHKPDHIEAVAISAAD